MLRCLQCLRCRIAQRWRGDDRGATAVEYGLLIVLIAAVIAVVVGLLGQQVSTAFQGIVSSW